MLGIGNREVVGSNGVEGSGEGLGSDFGSGDGVARVRGGRGDGAREMVEEKWIEVGRIGESL